MTDEAFDLETPYIPTPIYFSDADALSYVAEDAPVITRRVNDDWSLLLDLTTREPVGFRLERASRAFPAPSRAWTDAEVEAAARAFSNWFNGVPESDGTAWEDLPKEIRGDTRDAMRAALSTIRPAPVPSREEIARAPYARSAVPPDPAAWDDAHPGIREWMMEHADAIIALFTAPQSE